MTTVVEFVGLPGVGKTTTSRAVAAKLESQEYHVNEPTRRIAARSRHHRVASKARFVIASFVSQPRIGMATSRAIFASGQKSVSHLSKVLFNFHYTAGVVASCQQSGCLCLLDQGPYQGIWSIGFSSSQEWSTVINQFESPLSQLTPDLVVFVEADETTIADRLRNRTKGKTRFEPGTSDFDRALNGYEHLKSVVTTIENGVQSVVITNETREDLRSNSNRISELIQRI